MTPRYFKSEVMITTCCEHCGAYQKETLARLYADAGLSCSACGREHTVDRRQFRQTVDDTEAVVERMSDWALPAIMRISKWWKDVQAR